MRLIFLVENMLERTGRDELLSITWSGAYVDSLKISKFYPLEFLSSSLYFNVKTFILFCLHVHFFCSNNIGKQVRCFMISGYSLIPRKHTFPLEYGHGFLSSSLATSGLTFLW